MFIVEFVFALIISMLCAAMLLPVTARSGWRARHPEVEPLGVFALLLILFLATWAGGIWLVPIGPKLWGVAWTSFLVVALFVVLLVGTVTSTERSVPTGSYDAGGRTRVVNILTLVLLLLLLLAVVAGYAWRR